MASLSYSRVLWKSCQLSERTLFVTPNTCVVNKFYRNYTSLQHVTKYANSTAKNYSNKAKSKQKKADIKLPDVEGMNQNYKQFKSAIGATKLQVSSPSEYTFRSHTCGELTAQNVGETVTLCGWLTFKRMNGSFLVLRDLYGLIQLYLSKELKDMAKVAESVPLESVLKVTGEVVLRPESQRRNDQVSGEIEINVKQIDVLNQPTEIRLAYNDLEKVDEELCIQYRYLYLRNARAQSILRKRATFLSSIRRFMDANHFIDIETPTLIRRTPGGAREFPVLTKFKDSYYALAQSPQLLKQILMAGGMDKYYQIARCYRDETGRPDRQPEFTQLDIEMSFTTKDSVMKLVEDLLKYSCPESVIPDKSIPFPRIPFKESMEKYGSDKPDTGGFVWIVDFPLFLKNEQTNKLEAAHHPFTMPEDVNILYENPENAIGLSYDLVYCGAEVGGGSIRIHDAELQKFVFQNVLQLPLSDIDYLLDALQSGCPPHGGFALGIDRFLCKMLGTNSIRDVIAFPKSSEGKDLLSGAPTPLDPDSLKFYGNP